HGWVASSLTAVFRTTDGGRTWQTYPINYSADFARLQFIDVKNGWLAIAGKSHTEANLAPGGAIFHTTDGGVHWTSYGSSLINSGQISFVTPSIGLALDFARTKLYGSDDAGSHWASVTLPVPAGYTTFQLSLPSFATSAAGVLPATLRASTGAA